MWRVAGEGTCNVYHNVCFTVSVLVQMHRSAVRMVWEDLSVIMAASGRSCSHRGLSTSRSHKGCCALETLD